MAIRRALVTAVLLVSAIGPLQARAAELPVVAGGGGPGHGWISLKFHTDGAHAEVTVEALDVLQPGSAMSMRIGPDGRYLGGSQVLVVQGLGEAFVHSEPVPGAAVSQSVTTVRAPGYGAAVTTRYNAPGDGPTAAGTHRLLMYTTGRGGSWRWTLRGGPGVTLLASDTGTRTMSFMSSDFRGTLSTGGYVYGAGARAQAAAEKKIAVADGLAVSFTRFALGNVSVTSMVDPSGAERTCDCIFGPAEASGAGEYTFRLTGAGAGLTNGNEVFLGVADARLVL